MGKKPATVSHQPPSEEKAPEESPSRGLGILGRDPNKTREDIALARRALNRRWPVTAKVRRALVNRLVAITEKQEVLVEYGPDKDLIPMDGPADDRAIAAARVLVAMEGGNQSDEHHADDIAKPAGGVNVNVGIASDGPVQIYLPSNNRDKINGNHPTT